MKNEILQDFDSQKALLPAQKKYTLFENLYNVYKKEAFEILDMLFSLFEHIKTEDIEAYTDYLLGLFLSKIFKH